MHLLLRYESPTCSSSLVSLASSLRITHVALHHRLFMAVYIPPHKRRLDSKSLIPEQLSPSSPRRSQGKPRLPNAGQIVYAKDSIYKWLPIGSDNGQIPSFVSLEPAKMEALEQRTQEKLVTLVNKNREEYNTAEAPWTCIAEVVLEDIRQSLSLIRNEVVALRSKTINPTIVARVGKILFHQTRSSGSFDLNEDVLSTSKRTFWTNVTSTFIEQVLNEAVPNINPDFVEQKDIYHIKLCDETRPGATLLCKCHTADEKSLTLYKVELNQVRHVTVDFSCYAKDLDLRIMLSTKEVLDNLCESEQSIIEAKISSAVLDPDVKGGLRWKEGVSSTDRFSVVGVWHTTTRKFKSSAYRLKVREADRYDNRRAIAEETKEVSLKLKKLCLAMKEDPETEAAIEMLNETFKLLWGNFLCCPDILASFK